MRALCLLVLALTLALPASAAAQSGGNNPFGPLPQAPPAATPEPEDDGNNTLNNDSFSRETMFLIGAGVIAMFVIGGFLLTRDARRSLTEVDRQALERREQPRDPEQVRRERRQAEAAKRKQREKQRAAKAARKRTKRSR